MSLRLRILLKIWGIEITNIEIIYMIFHLVIPYIALLNIGAFMLYHFQEEGQF
jgi:hypothetical protein